MEDGEISIARVRHTHVFSANFMLVVVMNSCPCGYYGESRCDCTDYETIRYREKLSEPIMNRIDIQRYFGRNSFSKNDYDNPFLYFEI